MTPCIETTNYRNGDGYGVCRVHKFGKRINRAHVLAWVNVNERLPAPGMRILHHCDNPPCVNVEHLYEGTQADNARDRVQRGRNKNPIADAKKAQTHCVHGHEFVPENTTVRPNGTRSCKTCVRDRARAAYRRRRAEPGVSPYPDGSR